MNKGTVIIVIVSSVLLAILFANSIWPFTGNFILFDSVEYRNFKCEDTDASLGRSSIYTQGTVTRTLTSGTNVAVFEDECTSTQRVREYRCTYDAYVKSGKYWCKNGCSEGACIP